MGGRSSWELPPRTGCWRYNLEGKKNKTKAVFGRRCVLHFNHFNLPFPPRPFMNQYILIITIKNEGAVDSRLPRMVMEGVSFPSLKRVSLSIFAYGSLGFGSLGVPSTLAHFPMVLSHPTMLFKTQEWSWENSARAANSFGLYTGLKWSLVKSDSNRSSLFRSNASLTNCCYRWNSNYNQ